MTSNVHISLSFFSVLLVGCVERQLGNEMTGEPIDTTSAGGGDDGGGETAGVPTTSGAPGSTAPQPDTTEATTAPQTDTGMNTTGAGTTAVEDSCGFICESTGSDGVSTDKACDVFEQDCPEGEKCSAYAEGGGSSWNATKCVPVTGDGHAGDVCMTMGGGVSGLDDCAKGVMCWNVQENNQGTCIALCTGTEAAPVCEEGFTCAIPGEGVLNLCIGNCDPLIQDCPGDDLCIPVADTFVCVLDASGADAGAAFDPCEFANACDKGLMCLNPSAAVECDPNAGGCCMPFCDLSKPDAVCPGVGTTCQSLYAEGQAPPAFENVGVCLLPE